MQFKKQDLIPDRHPAQETRNLTSRDVTLRKNGFKIERRPYDGPAVWSLGETMYTEEQALEMCK